MTTKDNTLRRQRNCMLKRLLCNTASVPCDVRDYDSWRGLSAYQIATLVQKKKTPTAFHIFAAGEGLSEYKQSNLTNIQYDLGQSCNQFACPEEECQQNLSGFPFITYYKDQCPARFSEVKDRQLSFAHIEVDLYETIEDTLEIFCSFSCERKYGAR